MHHQALNLLLLPWDDELGVRTYSHLVNTLPSRKSSQIS